MDNGDFAEVQHILQARRDRDMGDMSVRPRRTPKMNLDDVVLQELIPWNIKDCHESVFTCSLSNVQV